MSIEDQLRRELESADFSGPEEATRPIPVITLAETSGRWRAQIALEEKQLRQVCSSEQTQRLGVVA